MRTETTMRPCCCRLPLQLLLLLTATSVLLVARSSSAFWVAAPPPGSRNCRSSSISPFSTATAPTASATKPPPSSSLSSPSSTRVDATATSVNGEADNGDLFTVSSGPTGPAGGTVHTLTFHGLPGQSSEGSSPVVIETGQIGRQANGAVTLSRGDTVLYSTACADDKPKEDIDFLPLSVDYSERFSSAGMTSGSYNKRDGRPAEHEVLTCRLIDRPLRPLITNGWKHETQLLSWVLSYDGIRSCDPLAITAASAALWISDVPLQKPVAAVQVAIRSKNKNKNKEEGGDKEAEDIVAGKKDADNSEDGGEKEEGEEPTYDIGNGDEVEFIINPTNEEMDASPLNLIIAGTDAGVLMIEGAADFLPESTMIAAINFGHEAVKVLCSGLNALGNAVGKAKNYDTIDPPVEGLQDAVDAAMQDRVDAMFAAGGGKEAQGAIQSELSKDAVQEMLEQFNKEGEDPVVDKIAIKAAFKDLLSRRMFLRAKTDGLRNDGRALNKIRNLDMSAGWLPRVHGSALFTRGETQTVATATLGDAGMRQKIDTVDGVNEKRFYLQYNFPPSCVGETGRTGMPGRREVGHGNLAERALAPALPTMDDFPYSLRVESLITESHGSSSMASVCGGCLALMDAGVPIARPVAGIAMGMLLGDKNGVASDDNAVILSDISGTEDALGTMDFKVAGDRTGITTFQLDIKCEGLTLETMERALMQAKEGRLHILDEMAKCLPEARPDVKDSVPKMAKFKINPASIGKIIGPGGKQIRATIEDFELENMDVSEEGNVEISSYKREKLAEAEAFVLALVGGGGPGGGRERKERPQYAGPEPVEGETYTGKITGIHNFGVFVEILPGAEDGSTPGLEGLVHVSVLAMERVRNCEAFMRSMNVDELTVKYIGKDKRNKIQLSRKAVLEEQYGGKGERRSRAPPTQNQNNNKPPPQTATMSEAEIDVIAQAIEGVKDRQ